MGSSEYEGESGESYFWSGENLRVKYGDENITIKEFSNHDLGIILKPKKKDQPTPQPLRDPPPAIRKDPLVLDLDGKGIATTGLAAGIHFDHDGDGFRELSGFITADNGFLVLDRNEDGKINDGTELFGDNTRLFNGDIAVHGFAALSEMDDDKSGVIDKGDTIFDKLRIFQDFNQNGITDDGELFSLADKKIAGLNLDYDESPQMDKFGNLHRQVGSFIMESGESRTMTDVVFTINRKFTTTDMLPVPENIAALPDAKGYGTTHDLHQAMVRDKSGRLRELVQQFINTDTMQARLDTLDQILLVWTNQQEGALAWENKDQILDSFFGTQTQDRWISDPSRYRQHTDTIFYQLSRQTFLAPFFDNVSYIKDSDRDVWIGKYDSAQYGGLTPITALTLMPSLRKLLPGNNGRPLERKRRSRQ